MGSLFSTLLKPFVSWSSSKPVSVLMVGLDNAGKSTLLYKMKSGETIRTTPTVGFNVEQLESAGLKLMVWDVGGQGKIRQLWKHYFEHANALIFIVDSTDHDRLKEAAEELDGLLKEDQLKGRPFFIFANKQDMEQAKSPPEVTEALGLNAIRNRQWRVYGTSAVTGDGLQQGFEELAKVLKDQ